MAAQPVPPAQPMRKTNWLARARRAALAVGTAAAGLLTAAVFAPPAARADVFTNVPEAGGYQLVYTLNVPDTASYNNTGITYNANNAAGVTQPFDRVAYYLELQKPGDAGVSYAYASMDAFTTNINQVGVPTSGSAAFFQRNVQHMNVFSNVAGVATGTNLAGGNIEFWSSNYAQPNTAAVPNADAGTFDFGDQPTAGGYGSMQVHNHFVTPTTGQTVLAYNRWGSAGGTSDIGIGNNPNTASGQNPDWTFSQNANQYTVKNLQVLVRLGTPPPTPPTIKVMPLGDSITDGAGAAGGYRTRLYQDFANAGLNVQFVGSATDNNSAALINAGQVNHEGHSGYRIDQIHNNLDGSDGSSGNNGGLWFPGGGATGRSQLDPDYILLLIGTNDFGQNFSISTAKDRLDALITKITADRPNAKLIVSNLLKRTDNATAEANIETMFNPFVPGIVQSHRALGQQVYFVDLNSVINPVTDLPDGLHPNQGGYDKMGDAWFAAIQAVPEPTALGLVPFAAVLVLRRRRRSRMLASL